MKASNLGPGGLFVEFPEASDVSEVRAVQAVRIVRCHDPDCNADAHMLLYDREGTLFAHAEVTDEFCAAIRELSYGQN
jgi:hypothetical protein